MQLVPSLGIKYLETSISKKCTVTDWLGLARDLDEPGSDKFELNGILNL